MKGETMSIQSPAINIGIAEADRAAIAQALSRLLADTYTYTLYLTTHNFHWNVIGPMFNTLHDMFMQQYAELWNAVDPIAERIRALGHVAPGSYKDFGKLASVPDAPDQPPKALEMVLVLVKGHEAVARTAREMVPAADKAGDEPTLDRLTQRLDYHEKTAWMLRSLLEDSTGHPAVVRFASKTDNARGTRAWAGEMGSFAGNVSESDLSSSHPWCPSAIG
jgi:starvation-inducible DNA-binding protein